jgi:hypothetical protein
MQVNAIDPATVDPRCAKSVPKSGRQVHLVSDDDDYAPEDFDPAFSRAI